MNNLQTSIKKFNNFIRTTSFFPSFLMLATLLGSIYFLSWVIFYKILEGRDIIFTEVPTYEPSAILVVFQVLILGPLIETLIFQKGVYFLLRQSDYLNKHKLYIVLIGGIFFGLLHFFSLSYVIVSAINGLFFMYAYIIKYGKGGYWMTVLLHAFVNALGLILIYFE